MNEDGKAKSVRQRLLNLANAKGDDYNQVLIRYVGLRFLSRLAASRHAEDFLLKGATMFLVWRGSMHRPTSDIDLLGYIAADETVLANKFRQVCTQDIDEDGLQFDPESVRIQKIREETAYGGLRCVIETTLGSAKLRVQVDVGFGDDVTPGPQVVEVPRLLETEVRRELRAYTPETVVAEKFEAIVKLGLANSRMKDYLDLDLLLQGQELDRSRLAEALRRTFRRRQTPLPRSLPIGLTEAFWGDEYAQRRWKAFVTKNKLAENSLEEVCRRVGNEILEVLHQGDYVEER